MNFKKYLDEVESKLRSLDPQVPQEIALNYIGGKNSKLEFLGLKVPQVRQVYEEGFSFLKESEEKVAEVWHYVWQTSNVYEAMSLGLLWFGDKKIRKNLEPHWPKLKTWANKIDNWAHSDELSGLYSGLLEAHPKLILPTLKEWGESVNPWLRRQSMVSMLFYSRLRKKVLPLSVMFKQVQKQLEVDHHYVQKGVGWTIREISNLHPKESIEFMRKNFERISGTAFSAAVEKLNPKQRAFLKNLRKNARVKTKAKKKKLKSSKPKKSAVKIKPVGKTKRPSKKAGKKRLRKPALRR